MAEQKKFVNHNLERVTCERMQEKYFDACRALSVRLSHNHQPLGSLLSLPQNITPAKLMEKIDLTRAAMQIVSDAFDTVKLEPVYRELTRDEYKRQFVDYRPEGIPSLFEGRFSEGLMTLLPSDVSLMRKMEAAFSDAAWLLNNCQLRINIDNKHSRHGSYMTMLKRKCSTPQADDYTPPTYEEAERFEAMLFIVFHAKYIPDKPKRDRSQPGQKRNIKKWKRSD